MRRKPLPPAARSATLSRASANGGAASSATRGRLAAGAVLRLQNVWARLCPRRWVRFPHAPASARDLLLFGLAVYLACELGLLLRYADQTSALWPANALLVAVLLSTRPRRWWLYLLAVIPGQTAAQMMGGVPLWRIAWLIPFNWAMAVTSAGLVRHLVGGELRLDDRRHTLVFLLVAVLAVPAVLSTLSPRFALVFLGDAADATLGDLALAWRQVTLSNAIANVTVVPMLLGVRHASWHALRRVPLDRRLEAIGLAVALVLAGGLVSILKSDAPGALVAAIYAPMLLLVWAALSFGAGSVGAALFVLTAMCAYGGVRGTGPYSMGTPNENVLALGLSVIAVSIPLLFLAALTRERRRAEDALRASTARVRDLAGRLIDAQESERTRISRELHDDINQRIAALSIDLDTLKRRLPGADVRTHAEFEDVQARVMELTFAIRRLSHELHPATIGFVGSVNALRAHCIDVARQSDLTIEFRADIGADPLPTEVSLCIYRVVQEALRNVVRHADARQVAVELTRHQQLLQLSVRDDGRGINLTRARTLPGLGLVSMDERVRLLGGGLYLERLPGGGTEVRVGIPLSASNDRQPATDDALAAARDRVAAPVDASASRTIELPTPP